MITYKAKSEYVDTETGEIITKKNALQNYKIEKTTKSHTKEDLSHGKGYEYITITIKYTRLCKRDKQLKLFG